MLRRFYYWLTRPVGAPRRTRRARRWRAGRILLWILAALIVVVILSQLFGGFQKGTRAHGMNARVPALVTATR